MNFTLTVLGTASAKPTAGRHQSAQVLSVRGRSFLVDCGEGAALSISFELVAQRFGAPRARVVESDGFAFDHAQLIADAYLKVGL